VLCTAFSLITIGLCYFWGKNIGTKAACKMLMKLIKDFDMSDRSYFDTFVGEGSSVLG